MTQRLSSKTDDNKSVLQQIRDFFPTNWTREIIGTAKAYVVGNFWKSSIRNRTESSIDESVPDYVFWDKLRHGKAKGFEISGLFAQPVTQIMASWVLSVRIMASLTNQLDDYTNKKINKFLRRNHGEFVQMVQDLYALGDQYAIVNNDGSVYFPSPELVDVKYSLLDHRKIESVTITTKRREATITDTYTATHRMLHIDYADDRQPTTERYENLIGKLPVVHFANDRANNESNGRPIYDALFRLFERYNTLVEKGLDGAELLGNPMPVFEDVEDVDEVISANSSSTEFDSEGNEVDVIDWGNMQALFVQNGKFDFKSPRINFTSDIREMLKVLFLLVLEFTRIPEAIWGGELTSSRSTAIEQIKTFLIYIQFRRLQLEGRGGDIEEDAQARGGFLELLDIWLRMKKLTDPRIVVDDVTMEWQGHSDLPPDVRLKAVQWASAQGWMSPKSAMAQMGLIDENSINHGQAMTGEDEGSDYLDALNNLSDDDTEQQFQAELLRQKERMTP